MADCQTNLLGGDGPAASTSSAKCADDREAPGLAQWMICGGGEADTWAGAKRVSRTSGALGADVKALGQPWASQPSGRA